MDYSVATGWRWFNEKEAAILLKGLGLLPQCNALLFDGSLTRFLEAAKQYPVDVEIKNYEIRKIDRNEAAYLEIDAPQEAIVRDAWLAQDKRRLIYARSIFPLAGVDKKVLKKISMSIEPLGRSLSGKGLLTYRDKLEICVVQCEYVSRVLNLTPEAIFWARHYRLLAQAPSDEKCITAFITEIFSHDVVGNPPQSVILN